MVPDPSLHPCASGDQTYIAGRTPVLGLQSWNPSRSPSLFLLAITIPDARAITMEKKKDLGRTTDGPISFSEPTRLRCGSSAPCFCFLLEAGW